MNIKILIIDDLEQNRKLLEAKLVKQFYEVRTAKNGLEGLKIIAEEEIDLVLLDVLMPEMDGWEVCQRIKNNKDLLYIPIIMVTSINDSQSRIKGLEAGADDFIVKPIIDIAFYARINSLIEFKNNLFDLYEKSSRDKDCFNSKILQEKIIDSEILLINDDEIEVADIKTYLKPITKNCTVLGKFDNTNEIKNKPEMIIVSFQMVEQDGLQICSKILKDNALKDIPLLALIDEDEIQNEKIIHTSYEVGIKDFLVSPIDEGGFKARVISNLKKNKLHQSLLKDIDNKIKQADTDQLTGLKNRYYFEHKAKVILAETKNCELNVMVIDIDHFKPVNDTYGHLCGDEVLIDLAKRLTESTRQTDIVARFGGEEFIVIMPDTTIAEASNIAEKIRTNIENEPFKISHEKKILNITVSIGVAQMQISDSEIKNIIERADKALYLAKETGRNKVQLYDK